MKQTTAINGECQHASDTRLCARDATWGTYRIPSMGLSKPVELDIPAAIFCGQHKPRLDHRDLLRNVKLNPKL